MEHTRARARDLRGNLEAEEACVEGRVFLLLCNIAVQLLHVGNAQYVLGARNVLLVANSPS